MKDLVILAPNWLGDAVMALPAIADVRRAAPDARIVAAARPAVAPLFALVPEVDDTMVLGRASLGDVGSWRAIGAELTDRGFDTALVLPNSIHSALIPFRAGIAQRWGYGSALRARLLSRAIARSSTMHQVDYYRHLVRALGFENGSSEPRIRVSDDARAAGGALLREIGWNGQTPFVALAPGAAYGSAKRWPPESFAELASTLSADGVGCVMIGGAADAPTAAEIERRCPAVANAVGRTDLPTLAGLLLHCRALVTNDSGAMHLAAAAGVPVTAVFGPTNEHETRPVGAAHVVVTHSVWCRPCMLRECPIDHRCMRGVRVATVLDAARRTL